MIRHRSRSSALALVLAPLLALSLATGCGSSDGNGTGGTSGSGAGGTGGRGGSGGTGGTAGTGGGTGGTAGSTGGTGGMGGTGGSAAAPLTTYEVCERAQKQGDFVISLNNEPTDNRFSGVDGRVMDGVEQVGQAKLVKEVGGCRILQPPEAIMCTPACDPSAQDCTPTGCRPKPRAKDLGTVTVTGMKTSPLVLTDPTRGFLYGNPGTLPHPAWDEGADITLTASGVGGWGPFTLKGWGVAPLVVPTAPVTVQSGQPVTLTWTPPGKMGPTRVFIDFSINRHGAVDAWLECTAPDTGSFTVTAEMTTELFKNGVSGFPSVNLTRQSGSRVTVMGGCVQLLVTAPVSRDLNVPGVVSCNNDRPCPGGRQCRDDLTCPP